MLVVLVQVHALVQSLGADTTHLVIVVLEQVGHELVQVEVAVEPQHQLIPQLVNADQDQQASP